MKIKIPVKSLEFDFEEGTINANYRKPCDYFRPESLDESTGICEASHNGNNVVNKHADCYNYENCPVYKHYIKNLENNK